MSDLEFLLPLTARTSESLQVFLLGTVDFESALRLQERFRDEVSQRNDRLGGLFVCEHPPVVTIGREGSQSHLRQDASEFHKLGIVQEGCNLYARRCIGKGIVQAGKSLPDPGAVPYSVMFLNFPLFCEGHKHYFIKPYPPGRNRWHYRQSKHFGEPVRINKDPEICSHIYLI